MLEKVSNFIIKQKEIILIITLVLVLGVVFIPSISGVSLTGNLVAETANDNSNSKEFLSIVLFVIVIATIFIFSNKIKDYTAKSIVSLNRKVRKGFDPDSAMSKKISREHKDLENKFSKIKRKR